MTNTTSPNGGRQANANTAAVAAGLARCYLPLSLLLCAAYAWTPLMGKHDFWAHAAVGRWIAANHRPPTETLFIWSHAPTPWVAHSWLSEYLFYELLDKGGPYAVVSFTVAMVVAVFALLWRMWSRQAPMTIAAPWIFALALWCSSARFQPRQELISALFLVLLLAYLIRWSQSEIAPGYTIAVVLMFALWVNLHALVAAGLGLLGVTAVCDCLQDRFDRRSRRLLLVFALCFAATLANPWGLGYWQAADQLQPAGMTSFIEEWRPFWAKPPLNFGAVIAEAILVATAVGCWAANPRRRWSHLVWLLLLGGAFAKSRRLLWLLAIVCLAVTGANANALNSQTLWREWRRLTGGPAGEPPPPGMRLIARLGTALCLALWVVSALAAHFQDERRPWLPISQQVPEAAVRYVLDHNVQGHIFNDYEHSSYLQWRFNGPDPVTGTISSRGQRPLFIDLLNGYPDQVMDDYFEVLGATPRGLELLREVDYIVLGRHHAKDRLVTGYLKGNPDWALVLRDANSFIWVRRTPRYRRLWDGIHLPQNVNLLHSGDSHREVRTSSRP